MRPWPWWRRHKIVLLVLVVLVVAGGLSWWRPWERCGTGMSEVDDQCVGLNLDMAPVWNDDRLNALQDQSRQQNDAKELRDSGEEFITVVVLNNMTPDPSADSAGLNNIRHAVAGALAAQGVANTAALGSPVPPVKLLMANYGSGARQWEAAVDQIVAHRDEQNIIAVAGLGQSLAETSQAAARLSRENIAVMSALASADDMNRDLVTGAPTERFYRITPTNQDAANAGARYLEEQNPRNVLLVSDDNTRDVYSTNLGEDFRKAYRAEFGHEIPNSKAFTSPNRLEGGLARENVMQAQFAPIRDWVCQSKPDWIYFAGRGADLKAFLRAVAQGGSCANLPIVKVLTSDDASSLQGSGLPREGSTAVELYYTSVATGSMWHPVAPGDEQYEAESGDYERFHQFFWPRYGQESDLLDGYAMAHHDAVLLPVTALRKIAEQTPEDVPKVNDNGVLTADLIRNSYTCQTPFPGATGKIAFSSDGGGNPINKAMPIMRMGADGKIAKQDLKWASGEPFEQFCR